VARAAGYRGAGTVEFLLECGGGFYFLEVNPRLQVEHPVTEAITGLDLVELQIAVAAGRPLPFEQDGVTRRGHAIECRLYAEDPQAGFLPSPGVIRALNIPGGPGIRFDGGVSAGDQVPVHYDPILAKLIAWGQDRAQAVSRLAWALREVSILGIRTPVELLLEVVQSGPFGLGDTHTGFLPRHFPDFRSSPERLHTALLGWLAAILEGDNRVTAAVPAGASPGAARPNDPWLTLGPWRLGQGQQRKGS
jgi:acetyl/propionyl-CoA carboxylase alpha subunit